MTGKERRSWQRVLSGISGNLAAGWYGHAVIAPGIVRPLDVEQVLVLTRSIVFGIVFTVFAFFLERKTK